MSHVIGIDIGSSGIKVGAFDREGHLAWLEYEPYSLLFPQPGWVEIDLELIWELVHKLAAKVCRQARDHGGEIEAISISCFCNASVFMDETGRPLCNGIMYMDQRSSEEADWIRQNVPEEMRFAITKNRIEPGMFSATTLLWVRNHRPELYRKTHKWGHLSSFILYKLTGAFVLDWTQASYTSLYDVARYQWSSELTDRYGIDERLLPEVVAPSEIVGRLLASSDLPLGPVPVVAGGADTACSSLALGLQPGELFESVGTSNVLTVCSDQPDRFDPRFMNRCHILKNRWLSHGAMSTPGSTIRWFKETFLTAAEQRSRSILDELALSSRPGANGLYFLPYMFGERTPIWDIHARGTFAGLDLTSTKADMLQAIYEGCAYGLRQIYEILDQVYALPCSEFKSIGGGAKNRHWTQIKSTVLGKGIYVQEVSESAVCGAARLAGNAVGFSSSLQEAVPSIGKVLYKAEPDERLSEFYEQRYQLFNELYPSLRNFFAKSSLLRNKVQ
ncbi:xylulokinase [Paenibacillus hamazuiensis]|uniref:xylulokinase n=1 Tax=Paenibacillus hamazuiensis TaxID=2936508 RepID=UPI002010BB47|nr:FGGY family carbohydrate kinase [Paenibacillus hamazuiensis]